MKTILRNVLIMSAVASACIYYCFIWDPAGVDFARKTTDLMVLNKTPTQITQLLGKPTLRDDLVPESSLTYKGPSGHYVRIYFNGGISDRTSRWIK